MRTRRGARHVLGILLTATVAVGACGPASTATESPASSAPVVVESPTSSAAASTQPVESSPVPSAAGAIVVDATLLGALPASIDGVALEPDPTTAAQIAADPQLADAASAIAVALAIRPGTSAGDDLAIASVIRLRPGVFRDAWFETWRASYDQSACAVAGGVKGAPSPITIAGRQVFVGTCAGDAQTYHVRLAGPNLIVSVTAAGKAHFGELVMAGLSE